MNKVETRVDARFDIRAAGFLPAWVKDKLMTQQASRIKDGVLIVTASEQRTQQDNIRIALRKIQVFIDEASYIPPPPSQEKKAKLRRVKKKANSKRLDDKKKRSERKNMKRNFADY